MPRRELIGHGYAHFQGEYSLQDTVDDDDSEGLNSAIYGGWCVIFCVCVCVCLVLGSTIIAMVMIIG